MFKLCMWLNVLWVSGDRLNVSDDPTPYKKACVTSCWPLTFTHENCHLRSDRYIAVQGPTLVYVIRLSAGNGTSESELCRRDPWARELAQVAKCFPREPENWSFTKLGVVTHASNSVLPGRRQVDPRGSLASQPSLLCMIQANGRPCLYKQLKSAGGRTPRVDFWSLRTHVVHVSANTHAFTCT